MSTAGKVGPVYHFPQLYEGDCFYDILSRFHDQSAHLRSRATSIELFGSCPDLRTATILPYRAGLIDTWLGASSGITMETLRDGHSAWQYLQLGGRFSAKDLVPVITADARPGRKKQAKMRAMLQNGLHCLRYCPKCLARDRLMVGEPFWHQVHQLYGVKYCPIHGSLLSDSNVLINRKLQTYVPASEIPSRLSLSDVIAEANDGQPDPHKGSYMSLVGTIDWLVRHGLELGDRTALSLRYSIAMGKAEGETVEGRELQALLLQVEGEDFLSDLFPDGAYRGILERLDREGIDSLSPLGHALVITALRKIGRLEL